MRKRLAFALILVLAVSLLPLQSFAGGFGPGVADRFGDVSANSWFCKFLQNAYDQGIVGGVKEDVYDPSGNLTHAQILVMVANLNRLQKNDTSDIQKYKSGSTHWCGAFLNYCKANGITDNRYDNVLDDRVTRSEMAYYFSRALPAEYYENKQEIRFTDTGGDPYEKEILKLAQADIVGGKGAGLYEPSALVTRAEASVFVSNIIDAIAAKEPKRLAFSFEAEAARIDRERQAHSSLYSEAKAQYEAQAHTLLASPVPYRVLWIGYTHVTYGHLDLRMTDDDRQYLKATALNFEKSVEEITDHCLDITVGLYFVDKATPLTKNSSDEWLYLAQKDVQADIDRYSANKQYDTVITTVQREGEENVKRNQAYAQEYETHYVMLGLKTAGLENEMGYSTFDLSLPGPGTYPLKDPAQPTMLSTAVAIHEWMHQLEYMGTMLGIEYPDTHAYMGPEEYPGYQRYESGKNDYDYCEFYKLVLKGMLPYDGGGVTRYVGMYPKMWPLASRSIIPAARSADFTIKDASGKYYLAIQSADNSLVLSSKPFSWSIRYDADGRYVISSKADPDMVIDLDNDWDAEGNSVKAHGYTGYMMAQSWQITLNEDGTYCIRTPHSSHRAIGISSQGAQAEIRTAASPSADQKWVIQRIY
ncbi:MAG: S-layer homology domain-containing protein [Firmicutes bacterium]|nr:S-layer homology domain-containing protein [Bacillota bacterium]MBR6970697.1 S-layer homology domain-containing protein [Bacillota bacterium]